MKRRSRASDAVRTSKASSMRPSMPLRATPRSPASVPGWRSGMRWDRSPAAMAPAVAVMLPERADAEPDHPPGDEAEHAEHGEHGQRGDALEAADGVVDVAQRQRHDEQAAAGALGAGHDAVAHVRVGRCSR